VAHGSRRFQALCLLKLGYAYQASDMREAAIPCLQQAMALFRDLGLARKADEARSALELCAPYPGPRCY
jgi:hypothetical protein